MYRCEDFTSIPRNRRNRALDFKLPIWSPFERTGYHAVWSDGIAMVWFWDSDKVVPKSDGFNNRSPTGRSRKIRQLQILPETVFYERKLTGLYLQPCVEGFEVQRWQAHVLIDAFWFPERPQRNQLDWFLARQDVSARAQSPTAIETPEPAGDRMLPEHWPVSRTPREWFSANRWALGSTLIFVLLLGMLWQEVRFWKVRQHERETLLEVHRLQQELTSTLAARSAFTELRRTNLALLAVLRKPTQARLMSAVDLAIPSAEAKFREWRYQRGTIKISVQDRNPDPIAYIRALEALPMFENVRAELGPDDSRLEITLKVQE